MYKQIILVTAAALSRIHGFTPLPLPSLRHGSVESVTSAGTGYSAVDRVKIVVGSCPHSLQNKTF